MILHQLKKSMITKIDFQYDNHSK